jgi:hypothetical protein
MREAAGFPWLTPHFFRHQAITVMLEQGHSPETIKQIAGCWVRGLVCITRKSLETYLETPDTIHSPSNGKLK